jgi:hypothetical protein
MSRSTKSQVILNVFNVLKRGEETTLHAIHKETGNSYSAVRQAFKLLCDIFVDISSVTIRHRNHGHYNIYQYVEAAR